jgi:hypothetical protein
MGKRIEIKIIEFFWFMDDTIDKLALKAELWSSQEIKVN